MIETLHELANSSGVERIAITIQSQGSSRVAVTIQSVLGCAPSDITPEQSSLRAALSQPVSVEGFAGEVEAKIDGLLTAYVRSVRPHADNLATNADKAAEAVVRATSAPAAPSTDEGGESRVSKVDTPVATPEAESVDFASDDASSL